MIIIIITVRVHAATERIHAAPVRVHAPTVRVHSAKFKCAQTVIGQRSAGNGPNGLSYDYYYYYY